MGNAIRRINKQIKQQIAMADAKIRINGCQVFLGSPDPQKASAAAKKFSGFFQMVMGRASCVNMRDLYEAHFRMLKKIESKESVLN